MRETFWLRQDLHVLVAAGLILGLGWAVGRQSGSAPTKTVVRDGLSISVPAGWLAEPGTGVLLLRGEDAVTHLEVRSLDKPAPPLTVDGALELDRGQRYGQVYQRLSSGPVVVAGRKWLRTEFAYAFKPTPEHAPRLANGVEYAYPADAAVEAPRLVVVTLHAPEDRIDELEKKVLGSIAMEGKTR
jgi:hypothetical protein